MKTNICAKKSRGFTIIEILVAIFVVIVLAVVGYNLLGNLSGNARDEKKKQDVGSIAKAFEQTFDGYRYKPITGASFASGKMPTTADGNPYSCAVGPVDSNNPNPYFSSATPSPTPWCVRSENRAFRVCASLGDSDAYCDTPSSTCYCKDSNLGKDIASLPTATPTVTPTPLPTATPLPTPFSSCTASWSLPSSVTRNTNFSVTINYNYSPLTSGSDTQDLYLDGPLVPHRPGDQFSNQNGSGRQTRTVNSGALGTHVLTFKSSTSGGTIVCSPTASFNSTL